MQKEEKPEDLEELEELESLPETGEGKQNRRLPPILRLSRRATVFLSLTLTALILFFITGNRQTFLDSNLKLILKIISVNGIALVLFATASSLECIFYIIKNRKVRLIVHLAIYLIMLVAGSTVTIFSLTINLLSEGISF